MTRVILTMHDGAVGLDGPPHDVVAIFEVDDDHLRRRAGLGLLPHADEMVGFERAGVEAYGRLLRNGQRQRTNKGESTKED